MLALNGLKAQVKFYYDFARHLRKEEHKVLGYARYLAGVSSLSKKHKKGEDKPEIKEREAVDEEKAKDFYDVYQNLRHQRIGYLRKEARTVLLAYGFLREKPYSVLEASGSYEEPDWDGVEEVVLVECELFDITPQKIKQRFAQWVEEAQKFWNEKGNLNNKLEEKVAA